MAQELVYNNLFNEFKGENPDEVIRSVYEQSRLEESFSYADWWKYQQDMWKRRYQIDIPEPHVRGACRKLLDTLVTVGALDQGPKPTSPQKRPKGFEPG